MKRILVSQVWNLQLSQEICRGIYEYMGTGPSWELVMISARRSELRMTIGWDIDGLIVPVINTEYADIISEINKPCVSTHAGPVFPGIPQIDVDSYRAGQMAAEFYLQQQDNASYGYIGVGISKPHLLRNKGFTEKLQAQGIAASSLIWENIPWNSERKINNIADWLRPLKPPLAIYCGDDASALYASMACQQKNLRIPEEVQIITSENDSKFCEAGLISISSLMIPFRPIGKLTAQTLDQMLQGEPPEKNTTLFAPEGIVERQSTR